MPFQENDGQGALFKNDRKEKDNHPDYTGTITDMHGTQYRLAAWIKRSGNKPAFMSLQMSEQQERRPKATQSHPADDDIPF